MAQKYLFCRNIFLSQYWCIKMSCVNKALGLTLNDELPQPSYSCALHFKSSYYKNDKFIGMAIREMYVSQGIEEIRQFWKCLGN